MKKAVSAALVLVVVFIVLSSSRAEEPSKRGEISGNVYTNNYFKVKYTKPAGYTFLNDEEISTLYGFFIERFGFEESVGSGILWDMICGDNKTDSGISISVKKMSSAETATKDIEFVDFIRKNFWLVSAQIEYDVSSSEIRKLTVGGKDFSGVYICADSSGTTVYIRYIAVRVGTYAMLIIATSTRSDVTDAILSGISFMD